MKYEVVDCHPTTVEIQRLLDKMSEAGWALKSTLSGVARNDGWLTFVFERKRA